MDVEYINVHVLTRPLVLVWLFYEDDIFFLYGTVYNRGKVSLPTRIG